MCSRKTRSQVLACMQYRRSRVAVIGYLLGWYMYSTILLAVGLAFAIGYLFTIVPMLRTIPIKQAARITVVGDTESKHCSNGYCRNFSSLDDSWISACWADRYSILDGPWRNTASRLCYRVSCQVLGDETRTKERVDAMISSVLMAYLLIIQPNVRASYILIIFSSKLS